MHNDVYSSEKAPYVYVAQIINGLLIDLLLNYTNQRHNIVLLLIFIVVLHSIKLHRYLDLNFKNFTVSLCIIARLTFILLDRSLTVYHNMCELFTTLRSVWKCGGILNICSYTNTIYICLVYAIE